MRKIITVCSLVVDTYMSRQPLKMPGLVWETIRGEVICQIMLTSWLYIFQQGPLAKHR